MQKFTSRRESYETVQSEAAVKEGKLTLLPFSYDEMSTEYLGDDEFAIIPGFARTDELKKQLYDLDTYRQDMQNT